MLLRRTNGEGDVNDDCGVGRRAHCETMQGGVNARIMLLHVVRWRRRLISGGLCFALVAVWWVAPPAAATGSGQHHAAPKSHLRPRIVGKPQIGVTLRATRGVWRPRPVVYEYRWFRCPAGESKCRRITGAVRRRYIPSRRDVGMTLRVSVTARNAAGSGRATSRHSRVIQASGNGGGVQPSPPAATSSPTVSGTAQAEQTLTASSGIWSGTQPIAYAYQWERCDRSGLNCGPITGATNSAYAVSSADVGSTIRVVVTASNSAGRASAFSAATPVVQAANAPPASDVALWHMDETSGSTMFDSVGTHNGTLHSVHLGLPGFSGTAYGFNGSSSYVSVPSADVLNPHSADITITIHLKTTGKPPSSPDDWDLIRKGYYSSSGGEYKVELQHSGQASCTFKGSLGYIEQFKAGPALNDGHWHTIQCIKRANVVELVVDGQVYSTSITIGTIANTNPIDIGARPGSDWTQATLDEARIQID